MKMQKKITRVLTAMSILALVGITISNLNLSVISDEIFSLQLTRHSWAEMIRLACEDVHPPLYYLILKIAIDLFSRDDPYRTVYIGKIVAVIPFYILFLFSWKVLRKHYSELSASIFSCLLVGLPSIIHVGTLIRMYSWGMLFVTLAGGYAVFILEGIESRRIWIAFAMSCIAACYTHYFCGVAVFSIYCSAAVWCLIRRRETIRRLVISAVCVVGAFLPWAAVLAGQLKTVSKSYWIPKITPAVILDYCKFYLAPYVDSNTVYRSLAMLLAILLFCACFGLLRKWNNHAIVGLMMLNEVEVVLVGITASLLIRPIFVARYAIPASGLLCLGLAIAADEWINSDSMKKLGIAAMCVCGLISVIDVLSFAKNEYLYRNRFTYLKSHVLDEIQADEVDDQRESVVITDSAHLQGAFSWYLPEVTVYGTGFDVTDYARRIAMPGRIDCWDSGLELAQSDEYILWIVHDSSRADQWMNAFSISTEDGENVSLEQVNMKVYSILSKEGK